MTPRRGLLATAPLALALGLSACAGSSAPLAVGTTGATVPPNSRPVAGGVPTDAQPVQLVTLTVSRGTVTGATGRVDVALGSRVRLTVLADTADEVHVHGYDLMQTLQSGTPAMLEFVATKPGIFEVELEGAHLPLTRLQVQ